MPCHVVVVSGLCTHRCMAQVFLRSCSLVVTLIITKEVRVLPPLFLQHGACQLIRCAVSVGFWCALLVLEPCSSTSSCALSGSDSSLEPSLVDQPRSHDVPTPGVEWSVLLSVSVLSFCAGCSGAAALFLPCGFAAWCVRHIQCGQGLTRTPLYEAPEGTVIRFPRPRSLTGSQ